MWCANIAELYQHTVPYILFVISFVMKSETLHSETHLRCMEKKKTGINSCHLATCDWITPNIC